MNKQKVKDFILHKVLRQYKLGWVGGFKDILTMVIFYMSIISFTLVAVTAYNTGLREWLLIYFPWMKIYIFYGVLLVVAAIAMVVEYKFVYPSFYAFRSQQEYKHQSPLRADLAKVLVLLNDISKRLEKLEKGDTKDEANNGK